MQVAVAPLDVFEHLGWDAVRRRPGGLPSTSSNRHGLTECGVPPRAAQRSRSPWCEDHRATIYQCTMYDKINAHLQRVSQTQ